MRKTLATVIAAGLVLGALSAPMAEAGKKKKRYKRTATDEYTLPSYGQGDIGYGCLYDADNCATFATSSKDKYVTMKLTDRSGQPVYFAVNQPDGPDDDNFTEDVGSGCGKSQKLAIPNPGQELIVYVPVVGSVLEGCEGPALGGTAKAVFTNR